MKKKLILIVSFIGLTLVIIFFGLNKLNLTDEDIHLTCTEEAKLCSDGSYVGRTGPNCEFSMCPEVNNIDNIINEDSIFTEIEAKEIASKTCVKGGEVLSKGSYNSNSKTWWFDANLNSTKEGCNPACVVSEETKTAEINWRCTGLLPFDSGVEGIVTLGPTCGVQRNPPDPDCADKPYATTIQVISIGSIDSKPFSTTESDKDGKYKVILPPGEYALQPVGGSFLPRCSTKEIVVEKSKIIEVNLSCDTGIR